ncbi:glycine zipper 2TM domain-containing protein [Proteus mirabilis]|uniref:glycine zipper 2TM domain-containing protein n=1 Tax=Proteus mirabilis TaxID=584 RepID=UPI002361B0F3|nr:glycine zipper 2TM domain-containing protein [Proteus mirabilis]MDC9767340.1 glycine zipper 2TM domain-containing protein [Proteus mirabilis]
MFKHLLVGLFAVTTLAGCVNTSSLSGDTYTASQAKQAQNVTYGTIVSVRAVNIQAGSDENVLGAIGGAVLGGLLGNTIGGGTGRNLATAAGAIAGGMAGQQAQGALNTAKGVQLEVRLDSGRTVVVVQKADNTAYRQGQRVAVIGNGNNLTVSPR